MKRGDRLRKGRRVVLAVALLSLPSLVGAQARFGDWREPVVVELELYGAKNDERLRELGRADIELGPGESFTVEAEPFDQDGRRFPGERFQLGVELDRRCGGRLLVTDEGADGLTFRPGRGRGQCRVWLYVPGNLNLEYMLDFELEGISLDEYTGRQAEEIARRLYLAILQRNIERNIFSTAVAEIQSGRLENQVSSMIDSREFDMIRGRSQPAELVDAFYRGLLRRAPDGEGLDDYRRELTRGRYLETVMNLIRSEEFEASLPH